MHIISLYEHLWYTPTDRTKATQLPSWVVQPTHWRERVPFRGTLTGLRGEPIAVSWSSTRPCIKSWSWVRAIPSTQTKNGLRETLRKRFWRGVHEKLNMCWQHALPAKKAKDILGCIKREVIIRTREIISPPSPPTLPFWDPFGVSGVLCIGSIRAEQNRRRIVGVGQGGHKDAHRIGTPLLWRKAEWAGVVLICRRLWGDFTVAFQYLRGPTKKLGRDSLKESTATGQRVMAFN